MRRVAMLMAGALLLPACGEPQSDPQPREAPPPPVGVAEATQRPDVLVAITTDRRLVAVDVDSGEELRVLTTGDDPDDFGGDGQEPIAGGTFLDSLAVDQTRGVVYLSTCCEPAPGALHTIPLEGGDRDPFGAGFDPALSPDGRRLAVAELQWLAVRSLEGGDDHRIEPSPDSPVGLARPAWSPDGATLAFELLEDGLARPRVHLASADATSMDEARPVGPEAPGTPWSTPAFDRHGRLVVAEQARDQQGRPTGPGARLVVDPASGRVLERQVVPEGIGRQRYDAGGAHLLTVLGDGRLRWDSDGASGELAGPFLAAAW